MRIALSVIFAVLILILGVCSFFAFRSKKPIGKAVAILLVALMPPVLGNLFIIASPNLYLSTAGCLRLLKNRIYGRLGSWTVDFDDRSNRIYGKGDDVNKEYGWEVSTFENDVPDEIPF